MTDEKLAEFVTEAKTFARKQFAHPVDKLLFSADVFHKKLAELIWQEAYDKGYNDGSYDTIMKERG